jgi:S-adenosylmethionine:tRNA ribosyltransferase-isomerase
MKREALIFDRPNELQAVAPAEERGLERDEVRLLISTPAGHTHDTFYNIARYLEPGDVMVVNRSATIPASLPACGRAGSFILNLSTRYGPGLWLAEPRWSNAEPGPVPLRPGEDVEIAGLRAQAVLPFPQIDRLWFVRFKGDVATVMARCGRPIRYGYVPMDHSLDAYQTIFSAEPGSAEMPSAGRPFTRRVLDSLDKQGVERVEVVLHTGVSSLEVEEETVEDHPLYPEPFRVPRATAEAVNVALREGRRVIAVGTTVVRALESAWDGTQVRPAQGFTRLFIHPARGLHVVDGLLTGFHDPVTSHLAMLYALAGREMIGGAYREAIEAGHLWHEFGDSHLILPSWAQRQAARRWAGAAA